MLPHNQVVQGGDLRSRRIKFAVFVGIAALLFFAANIANDITSEINDDMQHCSPIFDDETILKEYLFNYYDDLWHQHNPHIVNQTLNQTQECYLYYLFQSLASKHFKGFANQTYTHFHVSQYNQIKPEFNLSVLFSSSPYLDDPLTQLQFFIRVNEFSELDTPSIITLYNNDTDCNNSLTLKMTNLTTDQNISFYQQLVLDIQAESQCKVNLNKYSGTVKDNTEEIEGQVITYSLLNTVISLCSMIYGFKILRGLIEGQENCEEYSMISIGFIMVQDIYMCLFNFFQAMQTEKLFQFFITPSFLEFLLFSIFEMRILMLLWKSRLRVDISFREQVIKFYVLLYLCMFTSMFFIYQFIQSSLLLFILSLYLVPQILHSAQRGQFVKTNLKYVIGFLLPRVLNFIYFRIYPYNIFYLKPKPVLVAIIILGIVGQIIVYILQNEWGPQFFVPKGCLPQKYNYYIKIPISIDLEEGPSSEFQVLFIQFQHLFQEECSICMTPIHQIPTLRLSPEEERNFVIKQAVKLQKQNYMKTPCDHKFHVACLVKWMTIKLSCPSCRSALPPL